MNDNISIKLSLEILKYKVFILFLYFNNVIFLPIGKVSDFTSSRDSQLGSLFLYSSENKNTSFHSADEKHKYFKSK